jgi:hypothetical protein
MARLMIPSMSKFRSLLSFETSIRRFAARRRRAWVGVHWGVEGELLGSWERGWIWLGWEGENIWEVGAVVGRVSGNFFFEEKVRLGWGWSGLGEIDLRGRGRYGSLGAEETLGSRGGKLETLSAVSSLMGGKELVLEFIVRSNVFLMLFWAKFG